MPYDAPLVPRGIPMRKSTDSENLAALEEVAPRGWVEISPMWTDRPGAVAMNQGAIVPRACSPNFNSTDQLVW
jgi:hypothetical protein